MMNKLLAICLAACMLCGTAAADPDFSRFVGATITTGTASLTLSTSTPNVFYTGAGTTYTLPGRAASSSGTKKAALMIGNVGSGTLTVQRGGSDQLYTTAAVTSITVAPGSWASLADNGTYWVVRTGGISGSTGSTDKALLTANGTGGSTAQASTAWKEGAGGHLIATSDVNFDIGAAGANRPRNIFCGGLFPTGPIQYVGASVNASSPPLDVVQEWNGGGVAFTGIREQITDTASAASSLLMDLKLGGVSKFRVDKSGTVSGANIRAGDLTTSEYLYWKFDINVNDSSGNSRTGTLTGSSTYATTGSNFVSVGAKFFDGATKVSHASIAGSPTNLTVCIWIKATNFDTTSSDWVSIGTGASLRMTAGSTHVVTKSGGAWTEQDFGFVPAAKGWHHYASVWDDTNNEQRLYVDGVCTLAQTWSGTLDWGDGGSTIVGGHPSDAARDAFGYADDFRIYTIALTEMQIKELAGHVPHGDY